MNKIIIIKDWLLNNAVLLQTISAIVIIMGLPAIFFRWIRKPKVKLYFDPKETYHNVFAVDIKKYTLWIHIMVKNKSLTDIRNAQGFVSAVWEIKDGEKHILPLFRNQIKVHWAHENDYNPKDIIRRNKKRLDVCYSVDGDKILYLATQHHPSGTQMSLNTGEYILLMNLTAENISSKSYLLRVIWNGNYTELKAFPYKRNLKEFIFGLSQKI